MEFGRAVRGKSSSLGRSMVVAVTTGALAFAACTGSSERSLPQQTAGKSETPASTTTVVPARQTTLSSTTTLLSTTTKPVTGTAQSASAECTTVGFTPQTEDAASSIVASGLSCEEAEAFLRRLGPSVSPGGPARIELEGFDCVLTRHEEEPLPQGFYECTSGSKRITFVRS